MLGILCYGMKSPTISVASLAVLGLAIWHEKLPGLALIKDITGYTTLTRTARENLQGDLSGMKVSEHDATAFQRKLQGELLDYWKEDFKVNEVKNIATRDIPKFLNHVRAAYEGVDDEMKKKMNSIQFAKAWAERKFDFDCDKNRKCKATYFVMAFGKAQDTRSVDFIHARYVLEFAVAPKVIITAKDKSILWGLYSWQTFDSRVEEYTLGLKTVNQLRNYIRYKAMDGFYTEGYIDTVNYVDSIEDNSEEDFK